MCHIFYYRAAVTIVTQSRYDPDRLSAKKEYCTCP